MKRLLTVVLILTLSLGVLSPSAGLALTRSDRQKFPYTAVAYIKCQFNCGCTRYESGTMVARNGMVTAGSAMLCPSHNKKVSDMEFWFGWISPSDFFYHYNGSCSYRCYADFSNGYDSENDIGYIVFPENVGETTGWFASLFTDNASEFKTAQRCKMVGYDGDWDLNYKWVNASRYSDVEIRSPKGNDAYASGTPLCFTYTDYGETVHEIRAIYTAKSDSYYYARILTNNIYDEMIDDGVLFSH